MSALSTSNSQLPIYPALLVVSWAIVLLLCVSSPAPAQEPHAAVQGFGGLGVGSLSTTNANFGGAITGDITPNIQFVGEAGHVGNVLPWTTQAVFAVTPARLDLSAWYGQGGVRFTARSGAVRPYGEASAGISRLQPHVSGIGSGLSVVANTGLSLLDRTAPIATVGGGVTLQAGSFMADIGYRHRRVYSNGWIDALALGDTLRTNEIRVGLGFRF